MRKWLPTGGKRNPSVWTDINGMLPTKIGTYRTYPGFAAYSSFTTGPATPGTTCTAWCAELVSGLAICVIGTSSKLYDLAGTTFTDYSKGGGYTGSGSSNPWSFAQYGNTTIASNYVDAVQSRDGSGVANFADLAGTPPKAKIVVLQSLAAVLFNYNDGVNVYGDGWWASDIGDITTWTPASSNDAANGRLLQTPGPITAAASFRDEIVVFKASSVYRMKYVGAPFYWSVDLVSRGVGAGGMDAVCVCNEIVVFKDDNALYAYDGSGITPIMDYVSSFNTSRGRCIYFPEDNAAWFGGNNFVYNLSSNAAGLTVAPYSAAGAVYSSYVPVIGDYSARSSFFGVGGTIHSTSVVMVNLSANPCVIWNTVTCPGGTGSAPKPYVQSHYYGADQGITNFSRVVCEWDNGVRGGAQAVTGVTNTLTPSSTHQVGASTTGETAVSSSGPNGRFNFLLSRRFVVFKVEFTTTLELSDIIVESTPSGTD